MPERSVGKSAKYLPLLVDVAVLFGDADVLLSPHTAGAAALSVGLSDADVLPGVPVVTTGRAGLLGVSITLTFPSSALNRNTFVSLDFGALRSLLVPVRGRKDAERDPARGVELAVPSCT